MCLLQKLELTFSAIGADSICASNSRPGWEALNPDKLLISLMIAAKNKRFKLEKTEDALLCCRL